MLATRLSWQPTQPRMNYYAETRTVPTGESTSNDKRYRPQNLCIVLRSLYACYDLEELKEQECVSKFCSVVETVCLLLIQPTPQLPLVNTLCIVHKYLNHVPRWFSPLCITLLLTNLNLDFALVQPLKIQYTVRNIVVLKIALFIGFGFEESGWLPRDGLPVVKNGQRSTV